MITTIEDLQSCILSLDSSSIVTINKDYELVIYNNETGEISKIVEFEYRDNDN